MSKKKTIEVLLHLEVDEDYGQLSEHCIQMYFRSVQFNTEVKVTEISRADIKNSKTEKQKVFETKVKDFLAYVDPAHGPLADEYIAVYKYAAAALQNAVDRMESER